MREGQRWTLPWPPKARYKRGMKHHILAATVLCALALTIAPRAYAGIGDQSMDPAASNGTSDDSSDSDAKKPAAAPSPTPSSKAASAPAAAATVNDASLGPNEALFDAISRGDLDAARDAVARGADMNAENALGQKPVDASIDLGRNDITFMLLAQRPLTAVAESEPSTPIAPAPPAPAPRRQFGASHRQVAAQPVEQVAENKPAADPGTPQPAVGFLGF